MGKKIMPKMGNRPAYQIGSNRRRAAAKAKQKKPAKGQSPDDDEAEAQPPPPVAKQTPRQEAAHQQKLLGIFQEAFNSLLTSGTFLATVQEVKAALYQRDFEKAFGREDYLEAYAARWSPTRALCYASIMRSIAPHLDELCHQEDDDGDDEHEPGAEPDDAKSDDEEETRKAGVLSVLAIGGAAAEIVALGSYLSLRHHLDPEAAAAAPLCGAITLVDVAPWSGVVDKLRVGLTTPPTLSRYASHAAQAANAAMLAPRRLRDVTFRQSDVLALDGRGVASLVAVGHGDAPESEEGDENDAPQHPQPQPQLKPVLATLLFTLNELFAGGGVGKTTAFLLALTEALPPRSLLLVVDSPGSYSETTVGKEAKRYPMQWLLDRILLRADEDGDVAWKKVEGRDSAWFRLTQGLRYPIPLEDMRYQMHLYRRRGDGDDDDDDDGSDGEDDESD